MRLSVSTRIFLGFAVVIFAFGAASLYSIYRMTSLRDSVAVIWQDVMPVSAQLKALSRRLRAPEEFLGLKRPTDGPWLQRILPSLDAFEHLRQVEVRLEHVLARPALAEPDRVVLEGVLERLRQFRSGTEVGDALAAIEDLEDPDGTLRRGSSEESYSWLVRRTVRRTNEAQLTGESPEAQATVRMLRQINRVVVDAYRRIARPIRDIATRAEEDEKAATLAMLLVAAGALLVSLLMLLMSHLTLRPIRRLREGVRRIADGSYDDEIRVRGQNEIGQLAVEFNSMASALRARDAELARQREELLRADRLATIGKLAAQITHEVRNPLSSIGLNAELLEEEFEDLAGDHAEALAILRAIQDEVQRLKSITEQYLRYARLPQPEVVTVDLTVLLDEFLRFLSHELEEAGVRTQARGFGADAAADPVLVEADPDQLRQALLNVARNAVEALAGQDGRRDLVITLRRAGAAAVIDVEDSGPGIDPALRERIFEPFVTAKSGGTGLGLALAQQIVHGHHGKLTVESPTGPDGGTRFSIAL